MGKTTSRAAYMRARRAEQATPRTPHVCEGCGTVFDHDRADARFCSAKCRAVAWRSITHHALHYSQFGFKRPANEYEGESRYPGLKTCEQELLETRLPCGALATWRHDWLANRSRGVVKSMHLCDAHVQCPPGVEVGVDIREVVRKAGPAARKRHGQPHP